MPLIQRFEDIQAWQEARKLTQSAVEVQSLLYTSLDLGYIPKDCFENLYAQAGKTKALIGGFKHSLQKK